MKVLLAGATGYLGKHIAQMLKANLIPSLFIGRNALKLALIAGDEAEYATLEVTDAEALNGCCEGIDTVITTLGITRQRDGLNYWDVDYQANLNLLREAERAKVTKFIYISALKGESLRHLKIFEAKEAFVDQLNHSSIPDTTVIRPNGFFSDMEDFLHMAQKGRVFLFGKGRAWLNPIHGHDLAQVCVDAIGWDKREINVGGPQIFTQREIAELALLVSLSEDRSGKIIDLPDWTRRIIIRVVRSFTPQKVFGPIEFFLTVMGEDYVAPKHGKKTLEAHFRKCCRS